MLPNDPERGAAAAGQPAQTQDEAGRVLMIVEDDAAFARTLRRSFERRGYQVLHATSLEGMNELLKEHSPGYAVVDLKLKGEASGLACVQALHAHDADMLIVVLTGYASIATAVAAVKQGADEYLAKPANVDSILAALKSGISEEAAEAALEDPLPLSVPRLEWEHIQRVLAEHGGNISATARALNMHRRTLQRKLAKRPVSR